MNLLLLALVVFTVSLFFLMGAARGKSKDAVQCCVEAASLYGVIFCLVALVLLYGQVYRGIFVAALLSVASLLAFLFAWRIGKNTVPLLVWPQRDALFALAFVVCMVPIVAGRYEYIEMTGDPGVYSISAMHIAKEGKLGERMEIRDQLSTELRAIYDRDNLLWYNAAIKRGSYMPGAYFSSERGSRYYYQFYPAWPVMMALWAEIFGVENQHYVMVLFYGLSVLLFHYILRAVGVRPLYALLATIVLGASPLTVHFAKYPTSEIFLLFLVLFAAHLALQRTRLDALFAGLAVMLFCLTHISAFAYLPLLLLLVPFLRQSSSIPLAVFLLVSLGGFLISLPYGYWASPQYFIDVFAFAFGSLGSRHLIATVVAVASIALCGMAAVIYCLLRPREADPLGIWLSEVLLSPTMGGRLSQVWVLSFGVLTLYNAYILGWTTHLAGIKGSVWGMRTVYVNHGITSLIHLNLVSVMFATALVVPPIVIVYVFFCPRRVWESSPGPYLVYATLWALSLHCVLRVDTPVNYYAARYFLPVLVPALVALFAVVANNARAVWLTVGVVATIVLFNGKPLFFLYRQPIFQGSFAVVKDILNVVPPHTLVFFDVDRYSRRLLAQAMKYLGGIESISVRGPEATSSAPVGRLIQRYAKELKPKRMYIVSSQRPTSQAAVETVVFDRVAHAASIWYPTKTQRLSFTYYVYPVRFEEGGPGALLAVVDDKGDKERSSSELDRVTLSERGYHSDLRSLSMSFSPLILTGTQTATLRIEVRNISEDRWPNAAELQGRAGSVRVGTLWFAKGRTDKRLSEGRAELPRSLTPGDKVEVSVPLIPIGDDAKRLPPGDYEVWIGMLQEEVVWFYSKGDDVLKLQVTVRE